MTKVKTTEVPGHAKLLFIKLYCEKRGGETSENIHNASQSWLSLSHRKKKHFYETVSTKTAITKAQKIIHTKPFLKEKLPSISRKRKHNDNQEQHNNGQHTDNLAAGDNNSLQYDTIMECDSYINTFIRDNNVDDTLPDVSIRNIDNTLEEINERCASQPENEMQPASSLRVEDTALHESTGVQELYNELQTCNAVGQPNSYLGIINDEKTFSATELLEKANKIPPLEPTLPIAKTGKDLFELLKSRNGSTQTFATLSLKEKRFYGQAALKIKKDYVTSYKEYLESMSSRQLFDYYRKVFFN